MQSIDVLKRPPRHRQLLNAWHNLQKEGYAITAAQFLILADIIEYHSPEGRTSTRTRSRRLGICHVTVAAAQTTFESLGLVTLQLYPTPTPQLKSAYVTHNAIPTKKAYQLFNRTYRTPCQPSSTTTTSAATASGTLPRQIPPRPPVKAKAPTSAPGTTAS